MWRWTKPHGTTFSRAPRAGCAPTDEPYIVPIRGHVTGGDHRESAMASGEMTEAAFATFKLA